MVPVGRELQRKNREVEVQVKNYNIYYYENLTKKIQYKEHPLLLNFEYENLTYYLKLLMRKN
jgi:hypothetical protein